MSYIGIDPAADDFVASAISTPQHLLAEAQRFANTVEGIEAFEHWMQQHQINPEWIAIENTGVYSELLCYELHHRNYRLARPLYPVSDTR